VFEKVQKRCYGGEKSWYILKMQLIVELVCSCVLRVLKAVSMFLNSVEIVWVILFLMGFCFWVMVGIKGF